MLEGRTPLVLWASLTVARSVIPSSHKNQKQSKICRATLWPIFRFAEHIIDSAVHALYCDPIPTMSTAHPVEIPDIVDTVDSSH